MSRSLLATIFRLYHILFSRLHRLWPSIFSYGGAINFLPGGYVLKTTYAHGGLGTSEAKALQYIRSRTTIPVPRVYASAEGYGLRYVLMQRIEGQPLEWVWPSLNAADREKLVDQLRSYVDQLRTLPTIHGRQICAMNGEALWDSRITSTRPVGPFSDEAGFNDFLIEMAPQRLDESRLPDIRGRMRDDHRVCFTHGDLTPRNILVKGDQVMGIIDWEQAGWYPEYWELVKAMWFPMPRKDLDWEDRVKRIFSMDDVQSWTVDRMLSDHLVGAF